MLKALLKRMRSNEDGFTLVELLVVIVILGVLMGIGVPTYRGFITRSHEAATKSELAAISSAMKYAEIENKSKSLKDELAKTLQLYLGASDDGGDIEVVKVEGADTVQFLKKYNLTYVETVPSHIQADFIGTTEDRVKVAYITKDAIVFDVADITK